MINTQHNIKYITNPYKIWIIDNFMITEVINKINQEWLENDAKQWHSGRAMVGGKTNILDSIYHLSYTKSYFNPIPSQNIRHNEDFFFISGVYSDNDKDENDQSSHKSNNIR